MSKKIKKSKNFYLIILKRIQAGDYPNKIAKDLNISKQRLNYYVSFLKKKEIIRKDHAGIWEINKDLQEEDLKNLVKTRGKKISSLGKRKVPITDLHAFNIRFPILSGELKDKDWEVKNKLKNWIPKYKKLKIFKQITVRNNNNKSLSIFLKARKIDLTKDPYAVEKLAFRIKTYLHEYFKNKHDVILDVFNAETKNIHLETRDDDKLEGVLKKGEVYEVDLNKKVQKIFPKDNIDAKAWLDNSPDPNMIATNDLEYKKELVFMPFRVKDLRNSLPALEEYNKNLKLHIKVQEEQLKTQKKIQELLDKMDKKNE